MAQVLCVSRLDEERRFVIRKHIADLAEPACHDRFSCSHIFKKFRGRAEECASVGKGNMRRHQNIACIQKRRHTFVRNDAGKSNSIEIARVAKSFLNISTQTAVAYEEKMNIRVLWN